jgi:hypothetical protein
MPKTKYAGWLRRRSYLTQSLLVGFIWAILWFAIEASAQPGGATWRLLVGALVGGLSFGFVMMASVRWMQKRNGGPTTAAAIEKAVRTRAVPMEADPVAWLPLVERKRRSESRLTWLGPVEFGLFTVLGVYLVMTDPGVWIWWICLLLFAVAAIALPLWSLRRRPKIDWLIRELQRKDSQPASG